MLSYPRWTTKFEIKPGSWVFVPSNESVTSGNKIKSAIEGCWTSPGSYYHLRSGGHVAALKAHYANNYFIHLDIKNFFGSINKSRITRCLKGYFGYTKAREIATESTVKHPNKKPVRFILPFGFVQSPIIASLCLHKSSLGKHLYKLSFNKNTIVSVYMDDIIISTNILGWAEQILVDIKYQAYKSNFSLNESKEEGPSKQITAFNINLSHKHVEIETNRLSIFLYNFKTSYNDNERDGIRGYINSVNPNQSILFV